MILIGGIVAMTRLDNKILGILYVLLSSLFFALSSSFGKVVTINSNLSGAINSFSRFFLGAVLMLLYILITKKSFKVNKMKYIGSRSICNGIAILLFSFGVQYTTVTNANMLQMTYPIFVLILAPLLYHDKIKKSSYIYLTMILFGCYLVAFPSFDSLNRGDVLSLFSAIVAAFSVLSLKEARKYDEGYIIIFYVMLIGTFINLPFVLKDFFIPDLLILFYIIMSALAGFLGQIFITMGYKYVDNATGSMVSTSRILIGAILGIIMFGDPLSLRIVSGGILITLSLMGISGYFHRNKDISEA